jgi:hypothetical protein
VRITEIRKIRPTLAFAFALALALSGFYRAVDAAPRSS